MKMNEEMGNEVLRQANIELKDNDRKIVNLPSYQTYYCKGFDKIEELVDYMNSFIDSMYPLLAGAEDKTREMILKYVEIAEEEISVAKGILDMFKGR